MTEKSYVNSGHNVWKSRLVNSVTTSFKTTMGQMTEMLQWPKCLSEKINPAFELTASPVTCVSAAHQQWPASRWLWRKRHNPCKPRQCQTTRARWMSATPWMPPNRAPYHRWVRRSILACSTCTPAPPLVCTNMAPMTHFRGSCRQCNSLACQRSPR